MKKDPLSEITRFILERYDYAEEPSLYRAVCEEAERLQELETAVVVSISLGSI